MPDPADVGQMLEEVYSEIHRIAEGYVRHERAKSVQATELINEAYLRMAQGRPMQWNNRSHFVALAAIAMRRLLVEKARARVAVKRGGAKIQVTLDDGLLTDEGAMALVDHITLDRALTELARLDPDQAKIVELRYFGGLSVEETGEALGISPATVKRHWTIARAWLMRAMNGTTSA